MVLFIIIFWSLFFVTLSHFPLCTTTVIIQLEQTNTIYSMWPEKKIPETNSYIYRIFILIYLHLDLTECLYVQKGVSLNKCKRMAFKMMYALLCVCVYVLLMHNLFLHDQQQSIKIMHV